MIHRRLLAATAVLLMLFVGTTCAQANSPKGGRLHILLTNDDGYLAPGIVAVRSALLEAGFRVTVVAPIEEQSGSGVRITTSGTISCEEKAEGVWAVGGSPADAVMIGLRHLLQDDLPDLVVSGANFGHNLGHVTSSSGTVGAATMAMYRGFPAIAISVGRDFSERAAQPVPFPSTLEAFGGAAAFTVALIHELQAGLSSEEGLLPSHTLLNVNYPALAADEIQGVRYAPVARANQIRFAYSETGEPGEVRTALVQATHAEDSIAGTDLRLFGLGYITISVLDGDWDAGELLRESVSDRLTALTRERE